MADDDAERYIKIFTMLDRETIEALIEEHRQDPGQRKLQKVLAKEVTIMVHGQEAYDNAIAASQLLFGNVSAEVFRSMDERTVREVFANVPSFEVKADEFPCNVLDLLAVKTAVFPSKGEARKMVQGGGVSLNKGKVGDINYEVTSADVINGHYILAQKGKKNYFIINVI